MVTVHRASGLRIVIYVDDHEPAHVHVIGDGDGDGDGEIKIQLSGPDDAPRLVWNKGMKRAEVRRALAIVKEQRDELLAQWSDIYG
jgi:hypothetical protein